MNLRFVDWLIASGGGEHWRTGRNLLFRSQVLKEMWALIAILGQVEK
jgi:hypothetical protein